MSPPSSASPSTTSALMRNRHSSSSSEESSNHHNATPRSCILQVGVSAGRLCGVANTHMNREEKTTTTSRNGDVVVLAMSELLHDLWRTSQSLQLNLIVAIRSKLALNNIKYPVEHCKGKAGKYTQYSHITGVTKTNQSTRNHSDNDHPERSTPISLSELVQALPDLAEETRQFAVDRDWNKYHTSRNLILALLGEVGELAELLQWKGDDDDDDDDRSLETEEVLEKLSHELADVTIYLLRLATVRDVVTPLCEQVLQEHPSSSPEL